MCARSGEQEESEVPLKWIKALSKGIALVYMMNVAQSRSFVILMDSIDSLQSFVTVMVPCINIDRS